jgi:hypothetical protein
MGVLVNMREIDGATVVRLAGAVDAGALERIGEGIVGACGDDGHAIVLDINDLTLTDANCFDRLVRPLESRRVKVVCQRSSAFAHVREWASGARVPLFRTLADALNDDPRSSAEASLWGGAL